MPIKSTATLAGAPLLADQPISWSLTPGVQAHMAELTVRPADVERLLHTERNSVELKLGDVTVKGLSIIGTAPASDPYLARVIVVDRRYWWARAHVRRDYNMRRRVSKERRGDWKEALLIEPVDTIVYKAYSTKDGVETPWTPKDVLKDVLLKVDSTATIKGGPEPLSIPVEDLALDQDGASAIHTVCQYLPSLVLTITVDGEIAWDTVTSGNEKLLVGTGSPVSHGAAGPEIVGQGHVSVVDRSPQIPKTFRVLFTPEIEFRLNCLDIPGADGSTSASLLDRSCVNVAPLVDFSLALNGGTYAPGTWVPIKDLIAVYKDTAKGSLASSIDDELLRRACVPGKQARIFAQFNVAAMAADDRKSVNWMARLQSLTQNYRTTYQIPRKLLDRISELRPYLVGTIDRVTGQRAPAMVYSDHAIKLSELALYRQADESHGDKLPWIENITGYPGDEEDPGETHSPAPANVVIVDQDQGIFRIQYHTGPYGLIQQIAPSKIETGASGAGVPAHDLRASKAQVITMDGISVGGKVVQLSAASKAAVYLTVVPTTLLYQVTVTAEQIAAVAPAIMKDALSSASGPPVDIRVPPAIETARVMWRNGDRGKIESVLGLGTTAVPNRFGKSGEAVHTDDVIGLPAMNDTDQGTLGEDAASLQTIAVAVATSWVSNLIGLIEGSMTGALLPSAQVVGRISNITHTLDQKGGQTTRYGLSPAIPQFDMLAYLPAGTRRVIQRTVM